MKSTISCSVVSLVMKSSRSVMMSMQMLQVRSFLGLTRPLAARTREARRMRTWIVEILDSYIRRVESIYLHCNNTDFLQSGR